MASVNVGIFCAPCSDSKWCEIKFVLLKPQPGWLLYLQLPSVVNIILLLGLPLNCRMPCWSGVRRVNEWESSTEVKELSVGSKVVKIRAKKISKNLVEVLFESCFRWWKWIQHHQKWLRHLEFWSLTTITWIYKKSCHIFSKHDRNFHNFPSKSECVIFVRASMVNDHLCYS